MKKPFIFISLLLLCFSSHSQVLENIFSEQDGEKINIYYTISDAKPGQTFTISVSCATEERRFVLKSVSGDVGENISPGKNKKIVWDVLKDVESLESAEFFVKIEKINEPPVVKEVAKTDPPKEVVAEKKAEPEKKPELEMKAEPEKEKPVTKSRKLYMAFQPGTGALLGISGGTTGKFSLYTGARFFSFTSLATDLNIGFSIVLGPGFQIGKKFHLYSGLGYGINIWSDNNSLVMSRNALALDAGGFWIFNRLVTGAGLTKAGGYLGLNALLGFTF